MKPFVLLLAVPATFVNLVAVQAAKPCNPCDLRVAQSVAQKLQLSRVEPVYPPDIRTSGISGSLRIGYVIDTQGNAVRVSCLENEASVGTQICSAAVEAVKQWKYRPYILNGEPKEVETVAVLSFNFAQAPSPSPTPDAPSKPGRLRISEAVAEGNLIRHAGPHYPPEAKEKHIQGIVLLKVLIDRKGNVASCEQVEGDPVLGEASIDAVTQWKYRPFLLNGEPVEVETVIKIRFQM